MPDKLKPISIKDGSGLSIYHAHPYQAWFMEHRCKLIGDSDGVLYWQGMRQLATFQSET